MMKGYEKLSREERVARMRKCLEMSGGNLILDGAYLERVISLTPFHGLEDMTISEVTALATDVHNKEVLEIATWSLQFEDDRERDARISAEVIERLEGEFNYEVVRKICNLSFGLIHRS